MVDCIGHGVAVSLPLMKLPNSRLYERVAAAIARQIASGDYPVGQRLPSERDLAQAHDVSRPTIREAIIALEIDGLVEVRMGSGVYVVAPSPKGGVRGVTDVGPFEVLEARRAFEAEACAVAALRVTDEQIVELEQLLAEINNGGTLEESEDADRRFHLKIAECTANSVMSDIVEALWEARERSPQYKFLTQKAHDAGVGPNVDEHAKILEALRARDATAARNAMRMHLSRVLETLLAATEVQELEQARERVRAQRRKFTNLA